jgi:Protein of unknown function (DUF3568)
MSNKLLMIGVTAMLLAAGSGCALFVVGGAAAAGAGGYAYVKGEVKSTEGASLDRAWQATLAAMKDLEYTVTKQGKDALAGELTARNAIGKEIYIYEKKVSDTATEISIRVGTFGDEAVSRTILMKIKSHF